MTRPSRVTGSGVGWVSSPSKVSCWSRGDTGTSPRCSTIFQYPPPPPPKETTCGRTLTGQREGQKPVWCPRNQSVSILVVLFPSTPVGAQDISQHNHWTGPLLPTVGPQSSTEHRPGAAFSQVYVQDTGSCIKCQDASCHITRTVPSMSKKTTLPLEQHFWQWRQISQAMHVASLPLRQLNRGRWFVAEQEGTWTLRSQSHNL